MMEDYTVDADDEILPMKGRVVMYANGVVRWSFQVSRNTPNEKGDIVEIAEVRYVKFMCSCL